MRKIFLLLGSNLGALEENLINALRYLESHNINVVKKSRIYRTKPWGVTDQPDFLNMAVEIECDYRPEELLNILKKIESLMGRKKTGDRWGPRIIDIDILFYNQQIIKEKNLTIPHKEFYNRPFAIKLLSDIAPGFIPPFSDKPMKEYLKGLDNEGFEIYRH